MASIAPARVRKIVMSVYVAVILGLIAFLFWVGRYGERKEAIEAKIVINASTAMSVYDVKTCLSGYGRGLNLSKRWTGNAGDSQGLRGFNHVRHIGVRIFDLGTTRNVQIMSRNGKPLRQIDRFIIANCLGTRSRDIERRRSAPQ